MVRKRRHVSETMSKNSREGEIGIARAGTSEYSRLPAQGVVTS